MSEINYEKVDDIVVLRVIGAVTFTQITDAMNQYFPLISASSAESVVRGPKK
jgi:hypothetical protein